MYVIKRNESGEMFSVCSSTPSTDSTFCLMLDNCFGESLKNDGVVLYNGIPYHQLTFSTEEEAKAFLEEEVFRIYSIQAWQKQFYITKL